MIRWLRSAWARLTGPDPRIQERADIMADCVEAGKAASPNDIETAWRQWSNSSHPSAAKLRGYWWFARVDALLAFHDGWRKERP